MTKAKCLGAIALAWVGISAGAAMAQTQAIAEGAPAKIDGVISSRNGPDMTIQEADGSKVVGVLNDYTQVQMKEGALHFRKKTVDVTVLIPGLRLQVQGTGNANGQLLVQKVILTSANLQAARDIQAGVAPVEAQEQQLSAEQQQMKQQQAALSEKEAQTQAAAAQAQQSAERAQQAANTANQRINELNTYTTKYKTDVYFATGRTSLTPEAQTSLGNIASEALSTNAYMIQVAGFASKTGSAQINEELSNERADAVIAYLTRSGHIPLYRILAPAAMGASASAGSDPTLNQRVLVKVVVNAGIAQ